MAIHKNMLLIAIGFIYSSCILLNAQRLVPNRLPDSGQTSHFSTTAGEDSDFNILPPSFTINGDGTITDNNTGLIWQQQDAGEMTFENALNYCNTLVLGGNSDWRLPSAKELLGINHYNYSNPALHPQYFIDTGAEYWWTSECAADNSTKVWVVNAGGGLGAHPKNETLSAGGSKRIHARAVRDPMLSILPTMHFGDNADGTITDEFTGLDWQKNKSTTTMTWEQALAYAQESNTGGYSDWRLPNCKELQSLNDPTRCKPSFDTVFFSNCLAGPLWSSTSLVNQSQKAWDLDLDYGLISYLDKTALAYVLLVRGGNDSKSLNLKEVSLAGGEYEMGDHIGFIDPQHPSDELPLHLVKVDSFNIAQTETTYQQYLAFLNAANTKQEIRVANNRVYLINDTNTLCLTHQLANYYSISYDGSVFSISDFRLQHPAVGIMWHGAAVFCNWLSTQYGLNPCYNTNTWLCDLSKNGFRLPTEAEWEYAGRGGNYSPYYNYPWGDDADIRKANWPNSLDPYEGGAESDYPFTTPVGFYNGSLRHKNVFNWPGSAETYQTHDGANEFGLYDMAGNVWELINDWYGNNYYSSSPYDNPQGPENGFVMPDGKPYRGMRGGNWYNGYTTDTINNGHSRVSNRNPSYYRGPQDPNHPWYHIGFRVARKFAENGSSIADPPFELGVLYQNQPNPFTTETTIRFTVFNAGTIRIGITDVLGNVVDNLINQPMQPGTYSIQWKATNTKPGIYYLFMHSATSTRSIKMILLK